MQIQKNYEGISCGTPLTGGNLFKGQKLLLDLLPKGICYILECIEKSKYTAFHNFKKDILKA
jgi:hypothetical protein